MLFDAPESVEPDSILNWFNVCVTGLRREQQEADRLLGAAQPLPQPLIDELGIGASSADISRYFEECQEELALSTVLVRHWVAHGRYWKPKWNFLTPADVAEIILTLYEAFRKVAEVENLLSFA